MIPYGRQWLDDEDIQAVAEVMRSDFITTGPKADKFEQEVAEYTGANYAMAVSNGTAALHLACLAAGIQPGDEVITTAMTFAASANCVLYCGGRPVFADIDPITYNIDPEDLRRKITSRTKAVIPVHFTGQPCRMDEIHQLAEEYGLTVIEDGAHALGAAYKGKKIGGLSQMTTFSFHPVKPITTGEGGMVVTNDERLYRRLKLLRSHGITREEDLMEKNEGGWYYEQLELGYNYRMTDIQAALGSSQLKKLDRFIAKRREIADTYSRAFAAEPDMILPSVIPEAESGWHLYVIQAAKRDRKEVYDALRKAGLNINVHYIPVYHHPYYRNHGYADVFCPNAEQLYQRMVSLPIFPALKEEEQEYVIDVVKKAVRGTEG